MTSIAKTDKNVIVTGSTSGIGLGIATEFSKNGYNVMLNGLNKESEVSDLIESMKQHGGKILYSQADVSSPKQTNKMIDLCKSQFGTVDILINNAGIQFLSPIEDFPNDKWDSIIATNLSATFYAIKQVLPIMKNQNFGRIINIASTHCAVGSKNKIAYVAAKHGVAGLTKVVAIETADFNITCNAIAPGWVDTPLIQKQIERIAKANGITYDEATKKLIGEKQPKTRFTQVSDIGSMALFLCQEHANSTTGSIIPMDGGWLAQ